MSVQVHIHQSYILLHLPNELVQEKGSALKTELENLTAPHLLHGCIGSSQSKYKKERRKEKEKLNKNTNILLHHVLLKAN